MTKKRNIGSVAAIGGLTAVVALLTGLPGARADELADLQANMQLLQQRVDQLAQAGQQQAQNPLQPSSGGVGVGPPAAPGSSVAAGSFPRSFLIPGTDTSIRIGGIAWASVMWYLNGSAAGGALNGQGSYNQTYQNGQGGTGNLPSIPLNGPGGPAARSRNSEFDISGEATRFFLDARTPSPYGVVGAYIEMDFSQSNTNTIFNTVNNVVAGYIPRLRKAYATFAGLEAGQDYGMLHDPDADGEFVDFGGETGTSGKGRQPQVKYTFAGAYGTSFTIGAETPESSAAGPFGSYEIDSNQIPGTGACPAGATTAAGLEATTACVGSSAFFNPLQDPMPEWIATARINQPWGHVQLGVDLHDTQLNDGQGLDQQYLGGGGVISGDVHPFFTQSGALAKDDFGFGFVAGQGIGTEIANGAGSVSTDFGAPMLVPKFGLVNPLTSDAWNTAHSATRTAYDALVSTQSNPEAGLWIWYQHWWTPTLRSTIDFSGNYNDVNTNIVSLNTGPAGTAAGSVNKILALSHINLMWSPVGFVDFGVEYAWGHRVTTGNFKGDANTLESTMRVRF
jgi:hypothetical protein